jgi:serine/threonine-protein kinase
MLGQVILSKYQVSRLLDEGGMSKIYLGRQIDQPRDVAIKILKEHPHEPAKAREHFRREIHILSRFNHPNAVSYYDAAPDDPVAPVLVMEYLRGIDLNQLLHRRERFTPERAGRLLVQLCDVLQAAHDAGIVHRDLKPGNLMVLYPGTPQETLKLMDFGLAKMNSMLYISPDELVDWNLPAASGTPEYISPEQVRGSEIDGRGDIYSVGVVLFEMLTGRRPFEGSVRDMLRAHLDTAPPTFVQAGCKQEVPPVIEDIVRSCLMKNPDERPRSAKELATRYEKALGKRISGIHRVVPAGLSGLTPRPSLGLTKAAVPTAKELPDENALRHSIDVSMPEAMAMVKLKGFIYDLGGEVVESVPGMIKVRVADPGAPKPKPGLFGWSRAPATAEVPTFTEIELRMERRDPAQSSRLTITLLLRSAKAHTTPEWRSRCEHIGRDLQAYLMGR